MFYICNDIQFTTNVHGIIHFKIYPHGWNCQAKERRNSDVPGFSALWGLLHFMKTIERKVYYCEHCNKHSLSAGSMSRHEKWCKNAPQNMHKCFDWCIYLKKDSQAITSDNEGELFTFRKTFTCTLLNKQLYSFHAEKKGLIEKGYCKGMERMPLDCDSHAYSENNDSEDSGW